MIDPLPPITKVFNLVIQEERQQTIGFGSLGPTNSLASQTSSQGPFITNPSLVPLIAVLSSLNKTR